jgi:hypothetical protein
VRMTDHQLLDRFGSSGVRNALLNYWHSRTV